MKLNVDKQEFLDKWEHTGEEDTYEYYNLVGRICYEDDYYFVLELI